MKRISLVLAACALSVACSPQTEEPAVAEPEAAGTAGSHGAMEGGMAAASPGDSVATQGYKASMNTMMEAMPAFTGDADIDFMKQMRGHHVAAVAMARVELAQGNDAQARNLAQEVITAQEREITLIDAWLTQKGASAAPAA
ncbi:MAG: DUF305 domain-containing protein [Alphaproteobacteria bacterium]|nr:MAG: DUF305 domain-containing protein [Alphaproteobacteria bacterium]